MERSFAAEDPVVAVRIECAVVGIKPVFKDEAHLKAVSEIFRSLQAEAGAGVHAGLHGEVVLGISLRVAVRMLVRKAVVDETVKRNVGSKRRTCKCAQYRERSQSLFHLNTS